jgi:predicted phosphodiesterase
MTSLSLQIVSDLHLEINRGESSHSIPVTAPYIALLGDIGRPHKETYHQLLADLSSRYRKVFVVAGNHEYYDERKNHYHREFKRTLADQKTKIRESLHSLNNVFFLDNESHHVDGYTILGTTLWSDIPSRYEPVIAMLGHDYSHIYVDDGGPKRLIKPAEVRTMHQTARAWLESEIPKHERVIILSHHAPLRNCDSYLTSSAEFTNDITSYAYATDLSALFRPNVKLWAFGHTHYPCDFQFQGTRVVSNPRGYYNQCPTFDPGKVVTLSDDP